MKRSSSALDDGLVLLRWVPIDVADHLAVDDDTDGVPIMLIVRLSLEGRDGSNLEVVRAGRQSSSNTGESRVSVRLADDIEFVVADLDGR